MIFILCLLWAGEKPLVIMELFTSQGCSSCPPADRLLAQINDDEAEVILLSYHVDYWDYLGWKDPFGLAFASDRQRKLASVLDDRVYTPQVVIAGTYSGVGSDSGFVKKSLEKSKSLPQQSISWTKDETGQIQLQPQGEDHLHYAFLLREGKSKVLRGENRGRTLFHRNVVLEFGQVHKSKTIKPTTEADLLVVWQTIGEFGPLKASVLIEMPKANR